MPHISDSEKRKQAELLVKLANERSRVKVALKLTWDHYGIAEEAQAKMLECLIDLYANLCNNSSIKCS